MFIMIKEAETTSIQIHLHKVNINIFTSNIVKQTVNQGDSIIPKSKLDLPSLTTNKKSYFSSKRNSEAFCDIKNRRLLSTGTSKNRQDGDDTADNRQNALSIKCSDSFITAVDENALIRSSQHNTSKSNKIIIYLTEL